MKKDVNRKNITWLITGCSTGLGRFLAKEVLSDGYNAIVTSRNVEDIRDIAEAYPETALALSLDISNQAQIKNAIEAAEARFGKIDVLINNAGYGSGAP